MASDNGDHFVGSQRQIALLLFHKHSAIIPCQEGIMSTAKEHIAEIIKRQPDDSSYDEIVRELAFDLMVQRGLKDSDEGRTISHEEMERRIKTWQK